MIVPVCIMQVKVPAVRWMATTNMTVMWLLDKVKKFRVYLLCLISEWCVFIYIKTLEYAGTD